MNFFRKIKASLTLRQAINKADNAHAANGQRYYVMPQGKRKLIIMDRKAFRYLKHKRYITYKAFVSDLEKECFYCTPYANGDKQLTKEDLLAKRKQFFDWYAG